MDGQTLYWWYYMQQNPQIGPKKPNVNWCYIIQSFDLKTKEQIAIEEIVYVLQQI